MIEFLVVMFPPLQRGWVQYDGCDGSATTVIGMRWKQVPPKTFASVVFLYIFILFYSIPLYKSLVMVGSSLMWKLYDAFLPSLIFLFLFVLFCFVLVLFWFCFGGRAWFTSAGGSRVARHLPPPVRTSIACLPTSPPNGNWDVKGFEATALHFIMIDVVAC